MAKKKRDRLTTVRLQGLQFVGGNGRHITGVPARSLTLAEVGRLSTKQVDACIGSGLYVLNIDEEGDK